MQVRDRLLVQGGVVAIAPHQPDRHRVETLRSADLGQQRVAYQRRFGLDVHSREPERGGVAIATDVVQADLQVLRAWLAAHPGYPHSIGRLLLELDRVEAGLHVRVQIGGLGDLVEQLSRHGSYRDAASGAWMLGDDEAPILFDLDEREAGVVETGYLLEEGIITARHLGPALDQVTGGYGRSQASVTRGQITTSAPPLSASTMPQAPRYTLALTGSMPASASGVP